MPTNRTPPRRGHLPSRWPQLAVGLVAAHGLLHVYLQSRPGQIAIPAFVIGPRILFALTMVAVAAAAYDLLHGGWRRLLRGTAFFPIGALLGSTLISLLTYRAYPSSHDDTPPGWCLALPLDGDIAVLQGGRSISGNAHAGIPAERYAYDLAVVQDDGTYRGEGTTAGDHYVYAQTVRAPIAGTVSAVIDDQPDNEPGTDRWPLWRRDLGNRVVLALDSGQFLFVARLQQDSIAVRPGDRVLPGAPIGRVGNSGQAGMPHLHLHLQDHPELNRGESIPVGFCRYDVIDRGASWDTAQEVDRGMPTGRDRPQVIRSARPR